MGSNVDWRGVKPIFVLIKDHDAPFGFVLYESLVQQIQLSVKNVREYDLIEENLGNYKTADSKQKNKYFKILFSRLFTNFVLSRKQPIRFATNKEPNRSQN